MMKRIKAGLLATALAAGIGVATITPAQAAWWSYDEGWIARKLFYYEDCGGGRLAPVYAFYLNGTHYVHVTSSAYWSKRVGDRWGGNPYGSGC
jgi:hypothetical protein